jgi:hypothetical protein
VWVEGLLRVLEHYLYRSAYPARAGPNQVAAAAASSMLPAEGAVRPDRPRQGGLAAAALANQAERRLRCTPRLIPSTARTVPADSRCSHWAADRSSEVLPDPDLQYAPAGLRPALLPVDSRNGLAGINLRRAISPSGGGATFGLARLDTGRPYSADLGASGSAVGNATFWPFSNRRICPGSVAGLPGLWILPGVGCSRISQSYR